MSRDSFTT